MDYEKAYKEALERAKKVHKYSSDIAEIKRMEDIFPELKESEDERIRESIIAIINNYVDNSNTFKPKMLAWLEKQGEQNPTPPKWKYKKDNTPLLRDSIILNKYGGVAKSPSGAIVSDVCVLDYDELAKLPKEKLEKQVPQEQDGFDAELQESKDERTRKQIINFIEEYGNPIHCEWQKDWIAWLENQSKQKAILDELEMTLSVSEDAYLRSNIEKLIKELKKENKL